MTWFASLWERVFAHAWRLFFRPRRPRSSQPVTNAPLEHKKHSPQRASLLSLPDDILLEIIYRLTHSPHPTRTNSMNLVERHTYKNGLPLASTCTKLASVFYNSLDNVCLSSTNVNDAAIQSLATNASHALRRLVLRDCHVSNNSLRALNNAPHLRSLDLSFVRSIDHDGLTSFCNAAAPRLTTLLLRLCPGVNDSAISAVANCRHLHTLDVSYCKQITDKGIESLVAGCGPSLRLLAISYNFV